MGAKSSRNAVLVISAFSASDEAEVLTPRDVLEFQEEHADVAFTLDFPIPPKSEKSEAERRQR